MPQKGNPFTTAAAWQPPRLHQAQHSAAGTIEGGWTLETLPAELQRRGLHGYWRGRTYWSQCPCPEHDDRNPSLEVTQGTTAVVVKCHSGPSCTQAAVLAAIGSPEGFRSQPPAIVPQGVPAGVAMPSVSRLVLPSPGLNRPKHYETAYSGMERVGACDAGIGLALQIRRPARMGGVMALVVADLLDVTNARLAAGDGRAVPYASRTVAERLGVDDRRVREALERLRDQGVIDRVDEFPSDRWEHGTPLYAFIVDVPLAVLDAESVEAARVALALELAEDDPEVKASMPVPEWQLLDFVPFVDVGPRREPERVRRRVPKTERILVSELVLDWSAGLLVWPPPTSAGEGILTA